MYFGSVRFFKNLILLCVIILIAVPTVLAIRFGTAPEREAKKVAELTAEVKQLQQQVEALEEIRDAEQPAVPPQEDISDAPVAMEPEVEQPLEFTAEAPAYQSLYPDFYAPQPIGEMVRTDGVIYLTFDDGPTQNTDKILKVLAENDIKATFFMNGTSTETGFQRMKDIVAQGHTLGMHSYTHDYDLIYDSVENYLDDMYQLFVLIRDVTGEAPTCFRFPGGSINSYNRGIYQELIAEMLRRGFVPYDWNISAQDATSRPLDVDTVIDNVLSSAEGKSRGIVLMHDGASQASTAQALNTIIDRLREKGYRFDRIQPDTMPVLLGYLQ